MRAFSFAPLPLVLLLAMGCASNDPFDQVDAAFEAAQEDSARAAHLLAEATKTLEVRADGGNLRARHLLGWLHVVSSSAYAPAGLRGDSLRGIDLLTTNAEAGYAPTIYYLGLLHFWKDDYETSASYYRRAADLGLPRAQAMLGQLYAWGRGVERDPERAVFWLRRAMENGDGRVQRDAARSLRADVHNGLIPRALATEALDVAREIG